MFKKIICLTIAIAFFVNNVSYGLGTMPLSTRPGDRNRDDAYDMAKGLYLQGVDSPKKELLEVFTKVGKELSDALQRRGAAALGRKVDTCHSMGIGVFETKNKPEGTHVVARIVSDETGEFHIVVHRDFLELCKSIPADQLRKAIEYFKYTTTQRKGSKGTPEGTIELFCKKAPPRDPNTGRYTFSIPKSPASMLILLGLLPQHFLGGKGFTKDTYLAAAESVLNTTIHPRTLGRDIRVLMELDYLEPVEHKKDEFILTTYGAEKAKEFSDRIWEIAKSHDLVPVPLDKSRDENIVAIGRLIESAEKIVHDEIQLMDNELKGESEAVSDAKNKASIHGEKVKLTVLLADQSAVRRGKIADSIKNLPGAEIDIREATTTEQARDLLREGIDVAVCGIEDGEKDGSEILGLNLARAHPETRFVLLDANIPENMHFGTNIPNVESLIYGPKDASSKHSPSKVAEIIAKLIRRKRIAMARAVARTKQRESSLASRSYAGGMSEYDLTDLVIEGNIAELVHEGLLRQVDYIRTLIIRYNPSILGEYERQLAQAQPAAETKPGRGRPRDKGKSPDDAITVIALEGMLDGITIKNYLEAYENVKAKHEKLEFTPLAKTTPEDSARNDLYRFRDSLETQGLIERVLGPVNEKYRWKLTKDGKRLAELIVEIRNKIIKAETLISDVTLRSPEDRRARDLSIRGRLKSELAKLIALNGPAQIRKIAERDPRKEWNVQGFLTRIISSVDADIQADLKKLINAAEAAAEEAYRILKKKRRVFPIQNLEHGGRIIAEVELILDEIERKYAPCDETRGLMLYELTRIAYERDIETNPDIREDRVNLIRQFGRDPIEAMRELFNRVNQELDAVRGTDEAKHSACLFRKDNLQHAIADLELGREEVRAQAASQPAAGSKDAATTEDETTDDEAQPAEEAAEIEEEIASAKSPVETRVTIGSTKSLRKKPFSQDDYIKAYFDAWEKYTEITFEPFDKNPQEQAARHLEAMVADGYLKKEISGKYLLTASGKEEVDIFATVGSVKTGTPVNPSTRIDNRYGSLFVNLSRKDIEHKKAWSIADMVLSAYAREQQGGQEHVVETNVVSLKFMLERAEKEDILKAEEILATLHLRGKEAENSVAAKLCEMVHIAGEGREIGFARLIPYVPSMVTFLGIYNLCVSDVINEYKGLFPKAARLAVLVHDAFNLEIESGSGKENIRQLELGFWQELTSVSRPSDINKAIEILNETGIFIGVDVHDDGSMMPYRGEDGSVVYRLYELMHRKKALITTEKTTAKPQPAVETEQPRRPGSSRPHDESPYTAMQVIALSKLARQDTFTLSDYHGMYEQLASSLGFEPLGENWEVTAKRHLERLSPEFLTITEIPGRGVFYELTQKGKAEAQRIQQLDDHTWAGGMSKTDLRELVREGNIAELVQPGLWNQADFICTIISEKDTRELLRRYEIALANAKADAIVANGGNEITPQEAISILGKSGLPSTDEIGSFRRIFAHDKGELTKFDELLAEHLPTWEKGPKISLQPTVEAEEAAKLQQRKTELKKLIEKAQEARRNAKEQQARLGEAHISISTDDMDVEVNLLVKELEKTRIRLNLLIRLVAAQQAVAQAQFAAAGAPRNADGTFAYKLGGSPAMALLLFAYYDLIDKPVTAKTHRSCVEQAARIGGQYGASVSDRTLREDREKLRKSGYMKDVAQHTYELTPAGKKAAKDLLRRLIEDCEGRVEKYGRSADMYGAMYFLYTGDPRLHRIVKDADREIKGKMSPAQGALDGIADETMGRQAVLRASDIHHDVEEGEEGTIPGTRVRVLRYNDGNPKWVPSGNPPVEESATDSVPQALINELLPLIDLSNAVTITEAIETLRQGGHIRTEYGREILFTGTSERFLDKDILDAIEHILRTEDLLVEEIIPDESGSIVGGPGNSERLAVPTIDPELTEDAVRDIRGSEGRPVKPAIPEPVESTDKQAGVIEAIYEFIEKIVSGEELEEIQLTRDETRMVWEAVNLFHERRIEILLPDSLKLTRMMEKVIDAINRKHGSGLIKYRYYDDRNFETLLGQNEKGVERIIISEKSVEGLIALTLKEKPLLFVGQRLINIEPPMDYAEMPSKEKTVYIARIMTIAILARLLEGNKTPMIEAVLRTILENKLNFNKTQMDKFMEMLVQTDEENFDMKEVIGRIRYFLRNPLVKWTEILDKEIRIMQVFLTYA